ncbi:MAG: hypothetical protein LH614_06155 [Pyrinomonadaceae bacterium]|nr:hypothetical protein [Pyrinomonadaceae bacterium]
MNEIFIDTLYFAARLNPRDQWHETVLEAETILLPTRLVTTESVLIETLNFFADFPAEMKSAVADAVNNIFKERTIEVIPHTQEIFFDGLRLYESRFDKGYSLTDCISMNAMRKRAITEVLSHDNHFTQEGYTVLL